MRAVQTLSPENLMSDPQVIDPTNPRPHSRKGFGSMDKAKHREIAKKGGVAAHQKGTAHEFTADEARRAGSKGGVSVSKDRAHMAKIGRKGGQSKDINRKATMVNRPRDQYSNTDEGEES